MPSRGQSCTVSFVAWDTVNNQGKVGDTGNLTLRWVKDGTSAAPTNAAAEVDATNASGVYKLTLTTTECTCDVGTLAGKSSTAGVVIIPMTIAFEQLPTAAPGTTGGLPTRGGAIPDAPAGAAGGLPILGTGTGAINPAGGKVPATLAAADVTGNLPAAVADKTGFSLSAAGLDQIPIETGVNARQALSPILAAAAGVLSGAGTGTITIKGGNVAVTRIQATTDGSGNRSSVTLTLPT